jgi:hypothetical protein
MHDQDYISYYVNAQISVSEGTPSSEVWSISAGEPRVKGGVQEPSGEKVSGNLYISQLGNTRQFGISVMEGAFQLYLPDGSYRADRFVSDSGETAIIHKDIHIVDGTPSVPLLFIVDESEAEEE